MDPQGFVCDWQLPFPPFNESCQSNALASPSVCLVLQHLSKKTHHLGFCLFGGWKKNHKKYSPNWGVKHGDESIPWVKTRKTCSKKNNPSRRWLGWYPLEVDVRKTYSKTHFWLRWWCSKIWWLAGSVPHGLHTSWNFNYKMGRKTSYGVK